MQLNIHDGEDKEGRAAAAARAARRTYRPRGRGSPGARSSRGCGFASPVVPGGATLLTLRTLTSPIVVTNATVTATPKAPANKITAIRCPFIASLQGQSLLIISANNIRVLK